MSLKCYYSFITISFDDFTIYFLFSIYSSIVLKTPFFELGFLGKQILSLNVSNQVSCCSRQLPIILGEKDNGKSSIMNNWKIDQQNTCYNLPVVCIENIQDFDRYMSDHNKFIQIYAFLICI